MSAGTFAIMFCISFFTNLNICPVYAKLFTIAVNCPESAPEEHRMLQRYDTTFLEMLQVADYILLNGVNTSRSMVLEEFSARYMTGLRLVSASAIFFCPVILWITEISPESKEPPESGQSGRSL